jgi:hypothetical protein
VVFVFLGVILSEAKDLLLSLVVILTKLEAPERSRTDPDYLAQQNVPHNSFAPPRSAFGK